jgi:hypothetical protein
MLKVFIDGSGTGDPNWFVLAGYLSTAERWADFSTEWQRLIDMRSPHYRALDYFKMNEMTSDADRERCGWFYRVIEDHALMALSVVVNVQDLRNAAIERNWEAKVGDVPALMNPYFIAFDFIITGLAQHSAKIGLNGPVDFVFDNESQKATCIQAWEAVKKSVADDCKRFVGDTPIYRDDKTTLPLQAADLYAYWVREWAQTGMITEGVKNLQFPWPVRRIEDFPRLHMIFDYKHRSDWEKWASDPNTAAIHDFTNPPSSLSAMKKGQ